MEDVIKLLKIRHFRVTECWQDAIIDGDNKESQKQIKLLQQIEEAISILEKAENNTGS